MTRAFTPYTERLGAAVAAYDAAVTDLAVRHDAHKSQIHATEQRLDRVAAVLAKLGAV